MPDCNSHETQIFNDKDSTWVNKRVNNLRENKR